MNYDIILAGVGGQGILTIARILSSVALDRGMRVKQSETHGMSQRGGSVQAHLRVSDEPIHSDRIRVGRADLMIAVEPLEALRNAHFLAPAGALVSSVNAFVNVGNYPAIETVLQRISERPRHVMVDAERLARAAGSGRAANTVLLGAASVFLELNPAELADAVCAAFADAGERVVEANRRAFHFGRNASLAYLDGLGRGGTSTAVRHWIETLSPVHLAQPERPDAPVFEPQVAFDRLSGAEAHAIERMLQSVYESGRRQLFEHEVYAIVQMVGAISPPHHVFVRPEELIDRAALERFPGDGVVLKIVSPDVVHKTDANGIAFVPREHAAVQRGIDKLLSRHREAGADVHGVLVVEEVERSDPGFGNELFLGIRATREFGPVIAAGLGGIDTEYLARKMRPGIAVAKAVASEVDAEEFLELFRRTAAYEILSGRARGHRRIVSDGELLRCFRAFIALARWFCVDRGEAGPDVAELEVNPFAFRRQTMVPLDGRGRLGPAASRSAPRPLDQVLRLLEPRTIGVVGLSDDPESFGRIILSNMLSGGFPSSRLVAVKAGRSQIDGVRCVPSISDCCEPLDLLVVTVGARALPAIIDEAVRSRKVASAVLVSGGVGEIEGSESIGAEVRAAIANARAIEDGPVFIGPNSLGVVSRPGGYHTFFIPGEKLDMRWSEAARPLALVSQSGGFIISRMSRLEQLQPSVAVSVGNQFDVTIADLVRVIGRRSDIDVVGVYAEGFNALDGFDLLRAVELLRSEGTDVVFYKAGRTEAGASAAAGHTSSVAGDYDICQAGLRQSGALVAETFDEFEQLIELCTMLHSRPVVGCRVAGVSNAGFEAVGIGDALHSDDVVQLAELPAADEAKLAEVVAQHGLEALVNVTLPLDLTPMASGEAYEAALKVLLESDEVDAVVVGCIPLSVRLRTTPDEMADGGTLADLLPPLCDASDKPVVVVIDAGTRFDPLVRRLREAGVPVFRAADQAMRMLARYLRHRLRRVDEALG